MKKLTFSLFRLSLLAALISTPGQVESIQEQPPGAQTASGEEPQTASGEEQNSSDAAGGQAAPKEADAEPSAAAPTTTDDGAASEEPSNVAEDAPSTPSAAEPAESEESTGPTASGEDADDAVQLILSLEDAIRMAMENNLGVKIAQLDEMVSAREIVIARSAFDPFFNVSATFAKNRDPTISALDTSGAQGVAVNPSENTSYSTGIAGTTTLGSTYNLTLQLSEFDRPSANTLFTRLNPVIRTQAFLDFRQPLLKGAWYAVNTADIRITQNNLEFSQEGFEAVLIETAFQVESAYWQLVFSTQNLIAREKSRAVSLENLENARTRRDVGSFSENDVTTVESQWVLRKVDYEVAELLVENSRDALLDLINYAGDQSLREAWRTGTLSGPYDHINVIATTEPSRVPPLDRDAALASAFRMRPDYRQIEISLQNQRIRVDVARNGLLPQIDVFGRWTQLGLEETYTESYNSIESGAFYDWLVGVELSVPLSNRGPRNIYRNARAEGRRLRLQKKSLENQIVLEIDLAIRTIKNLTTRVIDLEEDVRLKQQLLEDEKSKLEVGRTIAYTVSTIENDLVTSETEALRANADLQTAKGDFYRATGTLLQRHNVFVSDN